MTCANHPDRPSTAFCQHCGKPICSECTRTAGAAVFCEPCLAARLGATPQPGIPVYASMPDASGEPSPTLAAILGFIPGVGAMYNGQYAKGIVHLIVFALLVSIAGDRFPIFGLFVAGWVFYQVLEAYHTARARRDGTPLPNPFGLNDLGERLGFGRTWPSAEPVPPQAASTPPAAGPAPNPTMPPYNYSYQYPPAPPAPPVPTDEEIAEWRRHRFPSGAFWLIALGLIFLLGNLHVFPHNSARELFPILIIGFGVWIFVRRMTAAGPFSDQLDPAMRRMHVLGALNGGFWLMLIGVLWLLDTWSILHWRYSWPLFWIAGGVMLLVRRAALFGMPVPPAGPAAPPPAAASADPGTALIHRTYNPESSDSDQAR